MLRADLHIHTYFSPDANISPQDIVSCCLKKGINCIAIIDHGTIEGAIRTKEISPFIVIIGEEIYTQEGEIMGLFLSSPIPHGLPFWKAFALIKEQGGLVGIPHPFSFFRRGLKNLNSLVPYLNFIEVFNARSLFFTNLAAEFAREYNIPPTAGSDAHTIYEIGNAYIEMPEFNTKQDFLFSLSQGRIKGKLSPIWVHFISAWTNLRRRLNV